VKGEVVQHDHVVEGAPRPPPSREHREERADHAGERDRREELPADDPGHEIEQEHERGGPQDDQRGQQRSEDDGRERDLAHWSGVREPGATVGGPRETRCDPALACTWAMRASTVASVLPVNAVG